mmetsp:Transcript_26879/g.67713  ORF Transcript_26879/g.67713 Transcript_26879/m.67713 type:complete len:245 (-) Transcript_26879:540-1274(-)
MREHLGGGHGQPRRDFMCFDTFVFCALSFPSCCQCTNQYSLPVLAAVSENYIHCASLTAMPAPIAFFKGPPTHLQSLSRSMTSTRGAARDDGGPAAEAALDITLTCSRASAAGGRPLADPDTTGVVVLLLDATSEAMPPPPKVDEDGTRVAGGLRCWGAAAAPVVELLTELAPPLPHDVRPFIIILRRFAAGGRSVTASCSRGSPNPPAGPPFAFAFTSIDPSPSSNTISPPCRRSFSFCFSSP